jgi:hypothetical protein
MRSAKREHRPFPKEQGRENHLCELLSNQKSLPIAEVAGCASAAKLKELGDCVLPLVVVVCRTGNRVVRSGWTEQCG